MAYPLGMDASVFLALDPKEKKRLAAERSRMRGEAQKAGTAIPPTIAEELGLSKAKEPRSISSAKKSVATKPVTAKPAEMTPEEREERRQRLLAARESFVPAGPVPSSLRTICGGKLHWVSRYARSEYEEAARERGFNRCVSYFEGEREVGAIYFKEADAADLDKIKIILSCSRGSRPTFGKQGVLN